MDTPSMVHRSGDTLIVRSVVSGDRLFLGESSTTLIKNPIIEDDNLIDETDSVYDGDNIEEEQHKNYYNINNNNNNNNQQQEQQQQQPNHKDESLPQCKIKRNYSCNNCTYFTQNPRLYLTHLRDKHGEKIVINECKHCLYASRHYQKLVRHMKMVHGSTDGLEEHIQSRKRASQLSKELKKKKHLEELSIINDNNTILSSSGVGGGMDTMNFLTNTPSSLEQQITNNKLLKCTICDFTTLYRAQLTDHERDEHIKTKFFRCTKCSYVTHIKARFSKHVKYHSMPMIKCLMCDFRTPYKWNLDRHMKNHGGTGPFKCAACNFTADIKQSLTVHEMNHHVPPVGHASGMSMSRRRNKVGGTDIPNDSGYGDGGGGGGGVGGIGGAVSGDNNYPDNSDSDAVGPLDDNYSFHNNNNTDNDVNMEMFDDSSTGHMKMDDISESGYLSLNDHLLKASIVANKTINVTGRKVSRPVPNLIPIQNSLLHSSSSALNLSIPANNRNIGTAALSSVTAMSQEDINDICQNSSTSALKDFASLFLTDEFFSGDSDRSETPQLSPSSTNSFKKKNANFFDKLKEKLVTNSSNGNNLTCSCGYISKCLSQLIIHQNSCAKHNGKRSSTSPINLSRNVGSTRCQFCRHRCKSSADLKTHLQTCMEAQSTVDSMDSLSEMDNMDRVEIPDDYLTDEAPFDNPNEPHPMENVVFVWNKLPEQSIEQINQEKDNQSSNGGGDMIDIDSNDAVEPKDSNNTYYGIETAPGYGEVTKKMTKQEDGVPNACLKKVFKCPHCSFWASTASRFHVHIVGHLNKKPFECSLCSYRSNWRWDITKHIRLKTIRDPSHKTAKVLMNDETGRRNYTKYNKYITLMKVTDEDGNLKLMKSGEMTPNQEATLKSPNLNNNNINNNNNNSSNNNNINKTSHDLTALQKLKQNENIHIAPVRSESSSQTHPEDWRYFENNNKKTLFKCKKCHFKHADRDVVLEHVKQHYREAGLLVDSNHVTTATKTNQPAAATNENISMNGILAMSLSMPRDSDAVSVTAATAATGGVGGGTTGSLIKSKSSSIDLMDTSIGTSNPLMAITNEHGETDEASSGGTSVPGWRGPAPYRCGHCHQVSNWKHVIQRHCRLKHNGDVRIELMEKDNANVNGNTNKNMSTYQIIMQQNNNSATNANHQLPLTSNQDNYKFMCDHCSFTTDFIELFVKHKESHLTKNYGEDNVKVNNLTEIKDIVDCDDQDQKQLNNSGEYLVGQKNKRYNCTTCPYITDSKSQFLYHKSFHKPRGEPFQCKYCNYNVTKKHLLNQHIKMHMEHKHQQQQQKEQLKNDNFIADNNDDSDVILISDSKTITEAIDLSTPQPSSSSSSTGGGLMIKRDNSEKLLLYCDKCPARFLSEKEIKLHKKMHSATFPYRCHFCSYTARQESYLQTHSTVHTTFYQDKTKELQMKHNSSTIFSQPQLILVRPNDSQQDIWLAINVPSFTDNNNKMGQQQKIDENNLAIIDMDDTIPINKVPNNKLNLDPKNVIQHAKMTTRNMYKIESIAAITNHNSNDSKLTNNKNIDNCPYCPYKNINSESMKQHLQHHVTVSGNKKSNNCNYCDFSVNSENLLKEHTKIHFTLMKNSHNVAFYTRYDNLELISREIENNNYKNNINNNIDRSGDGDNDNNIVKGSNGNNQKIITKCVYDENKQINNKRNPLSEENKIIINIKTGDML